MTVKVLKSYLECYPEDEEIYISIDDNPVLARGIGYEKTAEGEKVLAIG